LVSFNFYIEFGPHSFDYYLFFNHFPNWVFSFNFILQHFNLFLSNSVFIFFIAIFFLFWILFYLFFVQFHLLIFG
jgi:hypothetical protein